MATSSDTDKPAYLYHRLLVGYHGCDRDTVKRVLLDKEALQPSKNAYDWLGTGVYFWEHGYQRAFEFAKWKQARGEIGEPAVLGAYIHLGHCLDLTDTSATNLLTTYHEVLRQVLDNSGDPMPTNRPASHADEDLVLRDLDCAVINLALMHRPDFQTVRGVFIEGSEVYPGAKIYRNSHIQISVRDPHCILGYFLPTTTYT